MTSTIVTITDADIEYRKTEIYLHLELDVDGVEDFHSICLESSNGNLQASGAAEIRLLSQATGHQVLNDTEQLTGSIVRVDRRDDGSTHWSAAIDPSLAKQHFERKAQRAAAWRPATPPPTA